MDDVPAFVSTVQLPVHEVVALRDGDMAARIAPRAHGEQALEHPTGRSTGSTYPQPMSRDRSPLLGPARPAARQRPVP